MFKLAPSLLSADFWKLGEQVEQVVAAGARVLHVDVMDGHFVPNLTMGPCIAGALKGKTDAEIDVHLMVENPDDFLDSFAKAGADWISYHIEVGYHPHRTAQRIRDLGCKAGVAINPGTPIASLEAVLGDVDFVLLMSVNPGFGGQSFIPRSTERLRELRALIERVHPAPADRPFIQMDGGIGPANVAELHQQGMAVAVAGSSVFGQPDPAAAARRLIALAKGEHAS